MNFDYVIRIASKFVAQLPSSGVAWRPVGRQGQVFLQHTEYPFLAFTDGNLGDFKGAHATIDKTPADCVVCLRLRGRINALPACK